MKNFLSNEFLAKYKDQPDHMNALGRFVYYRTYSRYLPELGRRETWKETCARAVNYNIGLAARHYEKIGYDVPIMELTEEAQQLFDNMFNLRQFLSGRTLWVGGSDTGVADKFPLSNFNCAFTNIKTYDDLAHVFYALMLGTGIGFKCTKEFATNLPPIRDDLKVIHSDYEPLPKSERLEDTKLVDLQNGYVKIYVGDSKEGWTNALKTYLQVMTDTKYNHVHTVKFSYNSVRPHGERLVTFGGTASGHEPLKEMFEGIDKVVKGALDPSLAPPERIYKAYDGIAFAPSPYVRLRPIHILDIGNLIGNNVVVGGVRRTAEIFLMDADDYESIFAKYGINGIWDGKKHIDVIEKAEAIGVNTEWMRKLPLFDANARPLHHRRMSNNSIAFETQPRKEVLELVFAMMQAEGEPGFVNLEQAKKRRPNAEGLNPCAEIILASKATCNLTTVNVMQFVYQDKEGNNRINFEGLEKAQILSARAGLRMTLAELELPEWDKVQQRDRLLGCSITGWMDAMDLLDFRDVLFELRGRSFLDTLRDTANHAAEQYAHELRISTPLLVTTVKPEGTLSQVAGGVSSGLHFSHSPYYIRRIRINAHDPLARMVKDLGWTVHAEVGTPGETESERLKNARTWVIDLPVKSGAKINKDDVSALDQLSNYFMFQKYYTDHNSSNTITVKPDEWGDVCNEIYERWDDFIAVSFLANDGGSYDLAPYEAITEEEYDKLKNSMVEFKPEFLQMYENGGDSDLDGVDDCVTGACPIR